MGCSWRQRKRSGCLTNKCTQFHTYIQSRSVFIAKQTMHCRYQCNQRKELAHTTAADCSSLSRWYGASGSISIIIGVACCRILIPLPTLFSKVGNNYETDMQITASHAACAVGFWIAKEDILQLFSGCFKEQIVSQSTLLDQHQEGHCNVPRA